MSSGKHSDGKLNKKKVAITIIIILVIIGGIVWGVSLNNKKEEVSNTNTTSKNENVKTNEIKNESKTNTNSTENVNETKNETVTNKVDNKQENKIREADIVETQEHTAEEEKALSMAKKAWGNSTENVYFTIDNKEGNEYTITVRSKDTTNAVLIFIINIETGDVVEK